MKQNTAVTILYFVFCILLPACGPASRPPSARSQAKTAADSHLGDFVLKDVDNRTHALSDYLGTHTIVISFFAMWCEPCKKEMVHLDAIYRAHRAQGLVVLAVSMDEPETQGDVRPFVKQRQFSFPVLMDVEGVAAGLFNTTRDAPYNLIIDKNKTITWSKTGYSPGDEVELEAAVRTALETEGTP